ncbi:MAG: hypothetical protein R3Y40_04190 [Eubacteriales bacterium]
MGATKNKEKNVTMHTLIGLAIMLIGTFLPPIYNMTETGMQVITIFLGTLYLWSTVDILWPSIFSVFMIGVSTYGTMGSVMISYLGNATTLQLFFTMLFTAALLYYGVTKYIVRFCLSLKIVRGKPWAMTALLIYTTLFIGTFVGPFVSMFLCIPIMIDVYNQVGYKRGDSYVNVTMVLVLMASLMGTGIAPYRGSVLSQLNYYNGMVSGENAIDGQVIVEQGEYFIFAFIIACIMMAILLLVTRFILKPDVTLLKELDLEKLNEKQLPPLTRRHKILFIALATFILWMLLPSFLDWIPFFAFLDSNSSGASAIIVCVLMILKDEEKKPIINFQEVASKKFNYAAYFLSATAIFYGTVLTNDVVGLKETLNTLLSPVLSDVSLIAFFVTITILMVILTNAANSLVMNMLLTPFVLTYATAVGTSAALFVVVITVIANFTAALTPAASAYAAILFGNTEWISTKDIYKNATIYVIAELIVFLAIAWPIVNIFF